MGWENQGTDWREWQIFLEGIIPCDPHAFRLLSRSAASEEQDGASASPRQVLVLLQVNSTV